MKRINTEIKISIFCLLLAAAGQVTGCLDTVDGVTCIQHEDCASNTCRNGVCVGAAPGDENVDTAIDTASSSDTAIPVGSQTLNAVDLLFVVDNSGSMTEEQELISTSMYTLVNTLTRGLPGMTQLDVRMAVTTSDMGVSFEGGYIEEDMNGKFSRVGCEGKGDDGAMKLEYPDVEVALSVPVTVDHISCNQSEFTCPTDWVCTNMNTAGDGVCTPLYEQTQVVCPDLSPYMENDKYLTPLNTVTGEQNYPEFVAAGACALYTGTRGCNYEMPLTAISTALQRPDQQIFLRPNAITLIVVVSDEDDCSVASTSWFDLPEHENTAANLSCGNHRDLLRDVKVMKQEIIDAKTAATGAAAEGSVLFAAITGVPIVPECQGWGTQLENCKNVQPGVNGTGTMENPSVISRDAGGNSQYYFEYACTRGEVTRAYPAIRMVDMAREFGEMGFVYSICNQDWTPLMETLGSKILTKISI